MELLFKTVVGYIALGVETAAALIIAFGAIQALYAIIRSVILSGQRGTRRQIWVQFGVWLLLGLEFELAADVVRTAISPTWNEIGQLAAIALIRTFLNHFLEKDIGEVNAEAPQTQSPPRTRAA